VEWEARFLAPAWSFRSFLHPLAIFWRSSGERDRFMVNEAFALVSETTSRVSDERQKALLNSDCKDKIERG